MILITISNWMTIQKHDNTKQITLIQIKFPILLRLLAIIIIGVFYENITDGTFVINIHA